MAQQQILDNIYFLMLYGGTAMAALIGCVYLLLRKGNAFAADVTSPVRLRRWTAAFFAVSILVHIWWMLFYICSGDVNSMFYVVVCGLDCMTMMPAIVGTLLAMLQDRKRPFWPFIVTTIPYAVLLALNNLYPDSHFLTIAIAYLFLIFLLFTFYLVFAVRQYGRWLRDNYADLEHKEVWQCYMLIIFFSLFIIFYGFSDNIIISFLVHLIGLALMGILLWRVETLEQLDGETNGDIATGETQKEPEAVSSNPSGIGQLLEQHCEKTQLYLQHDLSLSQLAQAIGTNHYYLSQHFTQQGLTYNSYINSLRIEHFINLYKEAVASQRAFTAQKLANESGFKSYSTFGSAFKRCMGRTVTEWMRDTAE